MKRIAWMVSALLLMAICLTGCGGRPSEEIIEDIITYHGCYDKQADEKVGELMHELGKNDKKQAELWGGIVDYWRFVNDGMEINNSQVPDGLAQDDSLCIVVLGYALNADGTMRDELLGRLDKALECAAKYPNAYVLCTGGGTAAGNKDVTEAGQMGVWLLTQGLPESQLILEEGSFTTAQNAVNSYQILKESYPQVTSVIIVTSSYHIPWGALMFEAVFRRAAAEGDARLNVVSNYAYEISNSAYTPEDMLRWQTAGMLEIIGNAELARAYYNNTYTVPSLWE